MKKLILILAALLAPGASVAAGGGAHLMKANINQADTLSLQRGARTFVNYCLSCHAAKAMRYNRMAVDLGLTEQQLRDNLMFASDKPGDVMEVSMRDADAEDWFGTAPPDLSVISRSRGVDWLYTYLMSFYLDPSRPLGVNNTLFRDVGMPHVLWELQGLQVPVYKTEILDDGSEVKRIERLELVQPGLQSTREYERTVRDLVNFLAYMGEPAGMQRANIRAWVMAFLFVLLGVMYLLKREYWKDVH